MDKKTEEELTKALMECAEELGIDKQQLQHALPELLKNSEKQVLEQITTRILRHYNYNKEQSDHLLTKIEHAVPEFNKDDMVDFIIYKEERNIKDGNMSLEENHALIEKTIKEVCNKLNEAGIDYYLVGALPTYLAAGKLERYHDDIDFMVEQKDVEKLQEILKDTDYIFEDNRFNNNKKLSEKKDHTQGPHELIANHKQNEFHLGFFEFERTPEGDIIQHEYYMREHEGKKYPAILNRNIPKEIADIAYPQGKISACGTEFYASSPESVFRIKQSTANLPGRMKDKFDVGNWEKSGMIDHDKLQQLGEVSQAHPQQVFHSFRQFIPKQERKNVTHPQQQNVNQTNRVANTSSRREENQNAMQMRPPTPMMNNNNK